jgi:hypothetical protein
MVRCGCWGARCAKRQAPRSGQDFRLAEHLPGLFFTPDGEAVDFRASPATFRNIKLYKVRE